jgi:hypothetical protein
MIGFFRAPTNSISVSSNATSLYHMFENLNFGFRSNAETFKANSIPLPTATISISFEVSLISNLSQPPMT